MSIDSPKTSAHPLVLRPGWCVLPDGSLRERAEVHVADGLISAVGSVGDLAAPEGAEIIEAPDATLLPGLIDLHLLTMHLAPVGRPLSPIQRLLNAVRQLEHQVRAGVTSVRDTASHEELTLDLAARVEAGEVAGPHIYTAGRIIGAHARGGAVYGALEVNGADDARRAAREHLRRGVDFVSLGVTNGLAGGGGRVNGRPGWQELRSDEIASVVAEARAAGRRVSANALGLDGIRAAVEGGCDTVEHATEIDRATADLIAERGTIMVPTLTVMEAFASRAVESGIPSSLRDRAMRIRDLSHTAVEIALAAGVTIGAGTDSHGDETVIDEVRLLERAGLTHGAAVAAATTVAASVLEPQPSPRSPRGRIQQDAAADLLLVRGRLTAGSAALSDPLAVWRAGTMVRREPELASKERSPR